MQIEKELDTIIKKADSLAEKGDNQSILELCDILSHSAWPARKHAADLLESMSRAKSGPIKVLLSTLSSDNPDKRYWAANILTSLGEESAIFRILDLLPADEHSYGPLLSVIAQGCKKAFKIISAGILATGSEITRRWIIKALPDHLDPGLADALADALPRFTPELKFHGFSALADARDGRAFDRLLSPLARCPWPARGAGYRALFFLSERPGAPTDPAALCLQAAPSRDREKLGPALAAALAGSDPSTVALGAIRLVGPIARAALVLSIVPSNNVPRAAIAHLSDPEPEIRALSALILGRTGRGEDANSILPLLNDGDQEVRIVALTALKRLAPLWDVPPPNLSELITIGSDIERALALDLAARIRPPALPGLLIPLMDHLDSSVRARAAGLLGRARGDQVISTLCTALADSHWPVRRAASMSLARLGDEALSKLKNLADHDDMDAGYWAAAALGGIGGESASELLYQYAQSPRSSLRRGAIRGLSRIRDPRAVPVIEKALDDEDRAVRIQAIKGLLRHMGPSAQPRLMALASSPDPEIRFWSLKILSDSRVSIPEEEIHKFLDQESNPANRSVLESMLRNS